MTANVKRSNGGPGPDGSDPAQADRGKKPDWPAPYRPASPSSPPPFAGRSQEAVSPDWTTGRSSTGGGYAPESMRPPDAPGAAGPPPGNPLGSVLNFGRYAQWSLGEIA